MHYLSLSKIIHFCMRSHALRHLFATFCVYIFLTTPINAFAADDSLPTSRLEDSQLPWTLNADTVETLPSNTIVEAKGDVTLTRGPDILKADFARYFTDTQWIYLEGNVSVIMGRDTLRATSAEFDLTSRTGWLQNGNVFMDGPHTYFSGDQMVKHIGDRYTFTNARITTCDGDVPAWSLKADAAIVEVDGYAKLYQSTIQVKDNPLLYSPFLILPAKTSRQSGFLLPEYGYSSKRGAYYTQPYYHVIDESTDLTIYGTIMTEIGPLLSAEYRSQPLVPQKTWLMASLGHDRTTINNASENDVYPNSGLLRTNEARFWLRGMADGYLGSSDWQYRSTLDYVSDQNYLRAFEDDFFGFDYSRDALSNMFGRDIRDYNENRINALHVFKNWERFTLVASAQYTQDPSLGHGNRFTSQDETVQHFPQLDFFFNKSRLFADFPLEFEAHLQTAYFFREEGTRGLRASIIPRFSLPLDLSFFSLIGSVGLNQTMYDSSNISNTSLVNTYNPLSGNPLQTGTSSTLIDYSVKAFTEANRTWQLNAQALPATKENLGKTSWTAVRHDMQPRMEYNYTPSKEQNNNPFYTLEDRILAKNELTYSLTNIITRKGSVVSMSGTDKDAKPIHNDVYQDIMRLRFETGYDFNEDKRTQLLDLYGKRPFMDILTELEFNILSWASLRGKIYLSPYDAEVTRFDYGINFTYQNYGTWYSGLSYRTENYNIRAQLRYDGQSNFVTTTPENLLHNRFDITLTPAWSFSLDDYRDMRRGSSFGKTYDQTLSLNYNAQCYRFIFSYKYDEYDTTFSFALEIPGIFE